MARCNEFRFSLNSLTTRLILLGTVLLTGPLGRIVFLTDYLRKDISEQTSAQLLTIANYVAQDIYRDIIAHRLRCWANPRPCNPGWANATT